MEAPLSFSVTKCVSADNLLPSKTFVTVCHGYCEYPPYSSTLTHWLHDCYQLIVVAFFQYNYKITLCFISSATKSNVTISQNSSNSSTNQNPKLLENLGMSLQVVLPRSPRKTSDD